MLVGVVTVNEIDNDALLPFPHVLTGTTVKIPAVAVLEKVMLTEGVNVDAVNVAPVPE